MTKTFSFQQIAVPKVLSEEVREAIALVKSGQSVPLGDECGGHF